MKIAYTYHAFMEQPYGGISRYFVRLAQEMRRLGEEPRLFPALHQSRHLRGCGALTARGLDLGWLPAFPKGLARPINQALSGWQMRRWRPDLVHETFYGRCPIPGTRGPVVLTVYDMINERLPRLSYAARRYSELKRLAVGRADQIICISEHTRQDLLSLFPVDEAKVTTVHLGVDPAPPQPAGPDREPLVLFVGTRTAYKNFDRLAQAFAASPVMRSGYTLVAFGGKRFARREHELFRRLGLRPGQVRHETGDDAALAGMYRRAAVFVYPSLYEGFGIPPLEAMAHGCPVAASNCSSIPEVTGDAAAFFDPLAVDSIRDTVEKILADAALRAELVRRGYSRIRRFSWEDCARRTLEVYRRLV